MIELRAKIPFAISKLYEFAREVKSSTKDRPSTAMNTLNRIRRSVANRGDDVLLRNEFNHFGSAAQVGRALRELIPEALQKLGVTVMASRLTQEYNAGRSTQVPAGIVFNVGRRRIARKLGFNGKAIRYEHA
jgi:hypothetical protein